MTIQKITEKLVFKIFTDYITVQNKGERNYNLQIGRKYSQMIV